MVYFLPFVIKNEHVSGVVGLIVALWCTWKRGVFENETIAQILVLDRQGQGAIGVRFDVVCIVCCGYLECAS